jgi:hypothetical protein
MKTLVTILLVLPLSSWLEAAIPDTVPNWNFYYNKRIVLEGNSNDRIPKEGTVRLSLDQPGELVVTFNYDIVASFSSTLQIRDGDSVIKVMTYDSNPSGSASAPSVKTGSNFVIPLQDILDLKEPNSKSLDFYYSDEHIARIKIGTIVFEYQSKE